MVKVAPSILSADFASMGTDVAKLSAWGASLVHCDVMDGVFVPNMSFGPQMIRAIKAYTALPLDVHLMIAQPERYVEVFALAGADIIIVHQEATAHLHHTVKMIREHGVMAGVALNPATSLSFIENMLDDLDMVLVMTVNPGYGGQTFIPAMFRKIAALKQMIAGSGAHIEIEVDGGVMEDNAADIIRAGADILVAGNAIFTANDPGKALRRIAHGAQASALQAYYASVEKHIDTYT
jgi:ribulose-phosphate 3-epimerase